MHSDVMTTDRLKETGREGASAPSPFSSDGRTDGRTDRQLKRKRKVGIGEFSHLKCSL